MNNIREVLKDRYESTEEALRLVERDSLTAMNLDEVAEGFDHFEEQPGTEFDELASSQAGDTQSVREQPR